MRRLAALIAVLALAGTTAAAADTPPPFPRLPGTWSHAEINVTIHHVQHTLILDRGRIAVATPGQLLIRESGAVFVTVPLSQATIVTIDGVPSTIYNLRRRMQAMTMRIDGGAAVRVKATTPLLR
jgi:hypothetical protein